MFRVAGEVQAIRVTAWLIGSAVSCGTCCDKQAAINENEMLSSFTHTHTRFIPSCSVRITSVADASWLLLAWLMAVRTWLPAWPPGPAPPAPAHAMMGHPHHCCLAGVSAAPEPYASLHVRVRVRVRARVRVRGREGVGCRLLTHGTGPVLAL